MALAKRILGGEVDNPVAPVVAKVMADLEPAISGAITSEQTDGAREGALTVEPCSGANGKRSSERRRSLEVVLLAYRNRTQNDPRWS